jgi:hypothetical protein
MENQNREQRYFKAKEKVDAMRKFYSSLLSYVVFIALLGALNYWINEWSYPWFLWAAFGWGIGLVFQALKAFNLNPFFGRDWEEKKIRELMEKEEGDNKKWR